MKITRSISILIILFITGLINSLSSQIREVNIEDLISEYEKKGWEFLTSQKNFDSAEYYYLQALDLQKTTYGTKTERTAKFLVNLASVYKRKYDYKESFECSNQAEEIFREIDPESIYLGYIYHNIGNYYYIRQDFLETKRYYEYSLEWFRKQNFVQNSTFYQAFANYVDLLFILNEDEEAESLLNQNKIENLAFDDSTLLDYQILYASTFLKLNKFQEALNYLSNSRPILKQEKFVSSDYYNTYFYVTLINTLIAMKDYDGAIIEAQNAIGVFERMSDNSIDTKSKKAKIYYLYSYIKMLQGEYERALEIADIGLNFIYKQIKDLDEISKLRISSSVEALSDLLLIKSKVYFILYKESKEIDFLKKSYDTYLETIDLLNKQKLAMQNEGSKFLATENLLDVYLEAINISRILYNETSDMKDLETSFSFAESSKSFALLSEIRKIEAMQFAGLPKEIKEEDERLTREIQAYEEILYEEENLEEPVKEIIANTKEKIFHLRNSYNDLLQNIEHNYADYYQLKYDPQFVTIKDVQQKLSRNQALVEYVMMDTTLLTFVIEKDHVETISQPIDDNFSYECHQFYTTINQQDFSNGAHETYRNFVSLGRKFYKLLVEPVRKITDCKNLIVIPDGPIMYLPFEAFITEDTDIEYINYKKLKYLINELSIGYSHSATLLYSERFKTKAPAMKVLAFAPEYDDLLNIIDTAGLNRQNNTEFLLPLPGVIQEVEQIELMVPSRTFYGEAATETNFKRFASDYNILHLAMHTRMNDINPMMSNLVFTQTNDTLNDNHLYAYEIYNMQLNAQMAVLSSCASGFGNMLKGEGMMSLARGFIYAGCPSIIMTLWQVSDNSSAELMASFYRFLKQGKSKQEALRLAKIKYLNNADGLKANPYFWSGFVCIGDTSPVFKRAAIYYWIIIIIGLIAVVGVVQYYSGKKLRNR